MGARCGRSRCTDTKPCLQQFSIIRSIGRGAFGKVCIVQQRSSKRFFALKYMNKRRCIEKGVAPNVIRELSLLCKISHPFIVNLWYTFQDKDYMYMMSDLLLGGDLRYHLRQQGKFAEDRSKLYLCEVAIALDYLHQNNIIHRDVKPENILLDEQGHAHLTDLNLATQLEEDKLATSFSGTRPYMAPEIFQCVLNIVDGYDKRVDWWSLGITFYEMMRGRTTYEFNAQHTPEQTLLIIEQSTVAFPAHWPNDLISFLKQMICLDPENRITCLQHIKEHPYTSRIDFEWVLARRAAPVFVPCKEGLNCDPMHEIEERIIVSTPIHRRRNDRRNNVPESAALKEISQAFIEYSRVEQINGKP
ncbi:unnamed protein product [Auanema sp. JU1783]|nr:unnamed protein product [Auanema sp. JU1783]